jgi:UDP-N-acetylglucosamine 2-epimerase (non-hydrolysing)
MSQLPSTSGAVLCIVGARPNYMKMAPLLRAFAAEPAMPPAVLVHTGQHYDPALNEQLFMDLALPVPDVNLGVGSGSHAIQTAEVMKRIEPIIDQVVPACVVVVGDVNSTIAVGLVAVKKGVPVVHVEAGLRSYDRAMPEEINRVLTDAISSRLYTTERSAHANLEKEGIVGEHVRFVGNLMIDSLNDALPKAVAPDATLREEGGDTALVSGRYGVVTLHRPSNVDTPDALGQLLDLLNFTSERVPLVWPVHPRTRANLGRFGLLGRLREARIALIGPQGYLQMVGLMKSAALVMTDSGGIQEETTALGVPCLTLRDNTERPITVEQGTNTLVSRDRGRVLALVEEILTSGGKRGRLPEGWDGKTAARIAADLSQWLAAKGQDKLSYAAGAP